MSFISIGEIATRVGTLASEGGDLLIVPLSKDDKSLPGELASALGDPRARWRRRWPAGIFKETPGRR